MKKYTWKNEKDKISRLLEQNYTYTQIAKEYGVAKSTMSRALSILNLKRSEKPKTPLPAPKSMEKKSEQSLKTCLCCGKEISTRNKFCSTQCQITYYYNQKIARWKAGEFSGQRGEYSLSHTIRKYMLNKVGYKCELCGWGYRNPFTNTLPLEIHHKDGNSLNNREDNLQVLCPNCHALTATYKSHNKNSSRKQRAKYNKENGKNQTNTREK